MTLRNSLIAEIYTAIDRSAFTVADFSITFGNGRDAPLAFIKFEHSQDFSFRVIENNSGLIWATEAPGDYKKTEQVQLNSLSDIPSRVEVWIRNVRDELRTRIPIYNELDELKQQVENHIKEHVSDPEIPFTESEANEVRSKLDELLTRLQEMEKKSELTEQELNRLTKEIASIKANLTTFPKEIWYKTAANKLGTVMSKIATSKESRQVLAKAAQKMLGLDA